MRLPSCVLPAPLRRLRRARRGTVFAVPERASGRVTVAMLFLAAGCGGCVEPTQPQSAAIVVPVTPVEMAGVVGSTLSPGPTVRVIDHNGDPVPDAKVSFLVAKGSGSVARSVVSTDAAGLAEAVWTLGTESRLHTLEVRVGTLSPLVFRATAAPGPIARILASDGDGQVATPRSVLPRPLSARVVDAFSNPIPNATVTFSIAAGDGTIEGVAATSGPTGLATSGSWTLGPVAGAQKVRARVKDLEVFFTADGFACSQRSDAGSCAATGQLVFTRLSDGQLYRVRPDGTELTSIPAPGGRSGRTSPPAWSPDGRRLAFAREVGQAGDIYTMNYDGTHIVRRTTAAGLYSATWSPDGRKLAVSSEGLYESSIWIISADDDGSVPQFLVGSGRSPAWSPDGRRIAFVRVSGDDGYDELATVNPDGTDLSIITSGGGGRGGVAWSPDGRRIASTRCMGACDLYLMEADGSHEIKLTTKGDAQGASWSPDGAWIAFTSWSPGSMATIAYVPVSGGPPRYVASDGFGPAWRP